MSMRRIAGNFSKQHGFTLVEMMVALMVVSWVLSSAYIAISAFADQRLLMQKRFLGQSVAWNELMQRYRINKGWISDASFNGLSENEGSVSQDGITWYWQFNQQAALGRGMLKQTVDVFDEFSINQEQDASSPSASLVLFQVEAN